MERAERMNRRVVVKQAQEQTEMPSPTPTLGLECHLTNILSTSSGSYKAYPLMITTRCSLQLDDSTKIRVFRSNWYYQC